MRMNVEEREVTVALTSDRRRATHSGTGDGAGRGADMDGCGVEVSLFRETTFSGRRFWPFKEVKIRYNVIT